MQNGERQVGLRTGEGQAFEWRKNRHGESNGTFGSRRLGNQDRCVQIFASRSCGRGSKLVFFGTKG